MKTPHKHAGLLTVLSTRWKNEAPLRRVADPAARRSAGCGSWDQHRGVMMNAPIKTDWFDGHVKPTSVGVYEREMPWGDDVFCKWDGENWINAATTIEAAAQCIGISHFQEQPWRGIVPEVDGCVPVEASPDNSCLGCEFIGQHARCYKAVAAADCYREVIIWRPRSEVEE